MNEQTSFRVGKYNTIYFLHIPLLFHTSFTASVIYRLVLGRYTAQLIVKYLVNNSEIFDKNFAHSSKKAHNYAEPTPILFSNANAAL
jgi:hypothetical protein